VRFCDFLFRSGVWSGYQSQAVRTSASPWSGSKIAISNSLLARFCDFSGKPLGAPDSIAKQAEKQDESSRKAGGQQEEKQDGARLETWTRIASPSGRPVFMAHFPGLVLSTKDEITVVLFIGK
jgi:hypothetical protein